MWLEIFNVKFNGYYVKYIIEDGNYHFLLTDFIEIWEYKLTLRELTDLLKDNNPLLIADDPFFVKNTLQLFFKNTSLRNDQSTFNIEFSNERREVNLHITLHSENILMQLPLKFLLANSSEFCNYITLPMILKLKQLQGSEDQLISLVLKKDQEIFDYKAEGAKVSIKHLETQPFNIEAHNNMNKLVDHFISKETLPTIIKDLSKFYKQADNINDKKPCTTDGANLKKNKPMNLCKIKEVKSEPKVDIKTEPESSTMNHNVTTTNGIKRKKTGRTQLTF